MSRYSCILTVLITVGLQSFVSTPALGQGLAAEGITVFVAKKIYTLDAGWPRGTAVAV